VAQRWPNGWQGSLEQSLQPRYQENEKREKVMSTTPSRLASVLARQALSVPDQLDQLLLVVGRRAWVALLALTLLLGTAVAWACLARIPETVQGAGILVVPSGVRPLQALYEGQVIKVKVRAGQKVDAEEELAEVNIPSLILQKEQAETRLKELCDDDKRQLGLEEMRSEQEKKLKADQIEVLDQTIGEAKEILLRLVEQADRLLRAQREQTDKSRKEVVGLRDTLTEKVASGRRLVEQRLFPAERLLDMDARLLDSSLSLATLDMRRAEADLKEVEYTQVNAQQRARIADLRIQRLHVDTNATQVQQEIARARANRLVLRQEQEDRLRSVQGMLLKYGVLRSPQAGRVTEILLQPGQALQPGARIGTLQLEDAVPLTHLAYFPVASGKRIQPGMSVRATPTTVQRQRYGSIIGTVRRVSPFPITQEAAAKMLGNPEVVSGLLPRGGVIEVEVELQTAATPSGYRWTSAGSPEPVTAGTTTLTRVIVEERVPITYLLPVLRKLWEG
jgi:HlyD family secretion protein